MFVYGSGLSLTSPSHPWPHYFIEAQSRYNLEAFINNVRRSPLLSLDDDVRVTIDRIHAHLNHHTSSLFFPKDILIRGNYTSGLMLQAPQSIAVVQQQPAFAPATIQMPVAPPRVVYETVDHLGRVVARSYGDPGATAGAAVAETAEEKEEREFEEWKRVNGK